MGRAENYEKLKTHPYLNKLFKKVKKADEKIMLDFIEQTKDDDENTFVFKCNRLYLDKVTPKNWSAMWAILIQCKD